MLRALILGLAGAAQIFLGIYNGLLLFTNLWNAGNYYDRTLNKPLTFDADRDGQR